MADRYIGVNKGQYYHEVVSGSSTNSTNFELRYLVGTPRDQIMQAIEKISLWVLNDVDASGEGTLIGDTNF